MSSISSVPPEAETITNNHTSPYGFFFYNHYLTPGDIQYFSLRDDKLESPPPDLSYLNPEAKRHMMPLQSCNGLLLCAARESVDSKRYESVYVCNPITRQFKTITVPPTPDGWQVMGVNLAFDPSQSPNYFKILYFLHPEDGFKMPCDVNVYDSKSNTWNPSPLSLNESALAIKLARPVFCKRALHWYTKACSNSYYFDVDKESFHQFPMPSAIGNWLDEYFGESQGHLHMITKPNYGRAKDNGANCHVLELKEDYSGWFLKYDVNFEQVFRSVEFNEMVAGMTGKLMFTSVLSIIRADREEDTQLVLCSHGTFISYKFLGDGKLKKLMRIVPCRDPGHITWMNVVPVAKTLSHLI